MSNIVPSVHFGRTSRKRRVFIFNPLQAIFYRTSLAKLVEVFFHWRAKNGKMGAGDVAMPESTDNTEAAEGARASVRWRFSLRDLFFYVTVISTLLAACVFIVGRIQMVRRTAQKRECRMNLVLIEARLSDYYDTHDGLPPAFVVGENGHSLLSWRVLVADCEYYDLDFKSKMNFSQPWDSQTNSRFLSSLSTKWWQCPSSEATKPGITHYVAVLGPGTLWNENEARLSDSEKRILVIEWPDSDIHWAEPRDITLDQLLEWLKSKPETTHPECLLYVDGSGRFGELPIDSDADTVRRLVIGEPPPTPKTNLDQP